MQSPILILTLMVASLITTAVAAAPYSVGLTAIEVPDPNGIRPVETHILYPTDTEEHPTLIAENRAIHGFEAVPDAPKISGRFPLVLISHGVYGKWSNYGWLGRELAASGMIVALPTHPGTAWTNRDSLETPKLWERPRDLSRIITHLQTDPVWGPLTTEQPVAAIGHSLGGYTVLAAAGARFDRERYASYCGDHPDRGDCHWYRQAGVDNAPSVAMLERSLQEERLNAIISLDLGFTQAFEPSSVAAISAPTLVIGAGSHQPELPVAAESRHLSTMLPAATSTYHEIADISHFTFFPLCKPGAAKLLAAAGEGDEIICRDGGGRDRKTLHAALTDLIKTFLIGAGFGTAGRS